MGQNTVEMLLLMLLLAAMDETTGYVGGGRGLTALHAPAASGSPKRPHSTLTGFEGLKPTEGDYVFMCFAPAFLLSRGPAVTRIN